MEADIKFENNMLTEIEDQTEKKSFFGPHFRKWLAMKRALRLVQEDRKVHPNQIYIPRIQYKV